MKTATIGSKAVFLFIAASLCAFALMPAAEVHAESTLISACYAKCAGYKEACNKPMTISAKAKCERTARRCTRGCQVKYGG